MKSNEHKKMTFEDRFGRKYYCLFQNHPDAWHRDKVRNRRKYRRLKKNERTQEGKYEATVQTEDI